MSINEQEDDRSNAQSGFIHTFLTFKYKYEYEWEKNGGNVTNYDSTTAVRIAILPSRENDAISPSPWR